MRIFHHEILLSLVLKRWASPKNFFMLNDDIDFFSNHVKFPLFRFHSDSAQKKWFYEEQKITIFSLVKMEKLNYNTRTRWLRLLFNYSIQISRYKKINRKNFPDDVRFSFFSLRLSFFGEKNFVERKNLSKSKNCICDYWHWCVRRKTRHSSIVEGWIDDVSFISNSHSSHSNV